MISEDGFYGRGRGITLGAAASAVLHPLERRVVTVRTTGAGASLVLPAPAGRVPGGPYFMVYSEAASSHDVDIVDGDAAAVGTLAAGEKALITLERVAGGALEFKMTLR